VSNQRAQLSSVVSKNLPETFRALSIDRSEPFRLRRDYLTEVAIMNHSQTSKLSSRVSAIPPQGGYSLTRSILAAIMIALGLSLTVAWISLLAYSIAGLVY
jgi:hypothetical protein